MSVCLFVCMYVPLFPPCWWHRVGLQPAKVFDRFFKGHVERRHRLPSAALTEYATSFGVLTWAMQRQGAAVRGCFSNMFLWKNYPTNRPSRERTARVRAGLMRGTTYLYSFYRLTCTYMSRYLRNIYTSSSMHIYSIWLIYIYIYIQTYIYIWVHIW